MHCIQYKHLHNDRRKGLTNNKHLHNDRRKGLTNIKRPVMLYYNGDNLVELIAFSHEY